MESFNKIFLSIITGFFLFLAGSVSLNSFSSNQTDKINYKDSVSVATFSVVGDLMCHSVQYKYALTDSGYDFSNNYKVIKSFLSSADFTIGNLETVLAGKKRGFSGYPNFNTPDEYLDALKQAGFDFLVTANNHSLDKGESGLIRTINKIDTIGLSQTGTFRSQEERDSIKVFNSNDISFVLLAYTYGTNGISVPKGKNYLVNLIDTSLIKNDIQKAKDKNVDLIFVYYHFGNEYDREPSAYQTELVKQTIKFGADIILGSHPHVPQTVEFFKTNKDANLDSGFVAYSLGNFISNQRWRYSDGGPILNFTIVKDKLRDTIFVKDINIVPTWVFKGKINDDLQYVIIPSDSSVLEGQYSFLTSNDQKLFKQSYKDILEVMSRRTNRIKFYSPNENLKSFLKFMPFVLY